MEIIEDQCDCNDIPVITFCKKCDTVYLCDSENESGRGLNITLKDLQEFIESRE